MPEHGAHRQPNDVSQPVRHPDQAAEQSRDGHDVAAADRGEVVNILPGLPGRFAKLDAGGDDGTKRFGLDPAQGRQQRQHGADLGGEYSIPSSRECSLSRTSSAEPSPRPCQASTTVTPHIGGVRMVREADERGTPLRSSWTA